MVDLLSIGPEIRKMLEYHKTRSKHRKMKGDIDRFNKELTKKCVLLHMRGGKLSLRKICGETIQKSIGFDKEIGMYNVKFLRQLQFPERLFDLTYSNYFHPGDYMKIFKDLSIRGHSAIGFNGIKVTLAEDYDKEMTTGKSFAVVERGILTGRLSLHEQYGLDMRYDGCHIDITGVDLTTEINGENCCNDPKYHERIFEVVKRNMGNRTI